METLLTRVGRAAAMGLAWAFFWVPVVALASAMVVGELEPEHIGGPLYTGFACSAIFSALAGLASGRRRLERLSLREAAVLGAAAGCATGMLPFVLGDGKTTDYDAAWATLAVVVSMSAAGVAANRRWLGAITPLHAAMAAGMLVGIATAVVPWVLTSDSELWVRWLPVSVIGVLTILGSLSACMSVIMVRGGWHRGAAGQVSRT